MTICPSSKALATALALTSTLALCNSARGQEIELNDARRFQLTRDTKVTRNGSPLPTIALIQVGTGVRGFLGLRGFIQIGTGVAKNPRADDPAGKALDEGVVLSVALDDILIGPVTTVDPLTVLSIPVVSTGDTVLVGIPDDDLANLNVGDEVLVSGYSASNSSVRATRIERAEDLLDEWSIEGFASSVSASEFSIGPRVVQYSTALLEDCPGDVITAGQFVEVEFDPVSDFGAGDDLFADEVDCDDDDFVGDGAAVVDGLIAAVTGPNEFLVGDQPVTTNLATRFLNGTSRDVQPNVRVEVEGVVDPGTGRLIASQVRFRDLEISFEAPVAPGDIVAGQSITILRNTLTVTAQTEDDDGLLKNGITRPTQVEVEGYIDGAGTLVATEVEEDGEPELDDVDLRGPVAAIDAPLLTILGVSVDTNGAAFEDAFGEPITAEAFFAQIAEGISVGVEEGLYDPAVNLLSGGVVRIETEGDDDDGDDDDGDDDSGDDDSGDDDNGDDDNGDDDNGDDDNGDDDNGDDDGPDGKGLATGGRVNGIITAIASDVLFANGFE